MNFDIVRSVLDLAAETKEIISICTVDDGSARVTSTMGRTDYMACFTLMNLQLDVVPGTNVSWCTVMLWSVSSIILGRSLLAANESVQARTIPTQSTERWYIGLKVNARLYA